MLQDADNWRDGESHVELGNRRRKFLMLHQALRVEAETHRSTHVQQIFEVISRDYFCDKARVSTSARKRTLRCCATIALLLQGRDGDSQNRNIKLSNCESLVFRLVVSFDRGL